MAASSAGRRRGSWLVAALLALLGAACRGPAPEGPGPTTTGTPARADLPAYVRLPVRGRAQAHNLSCESRSACDLLGWHGMPQRDEEAFLAGLPRSDNPDEGFVGDVDGPGEQLPGAGRGYGVHEAPIAARLRVYGLEARAERGFTLDRLRAEVAAGRPVIVWATLRLEAPPVVRGRDAAGRVYEAVRGEHTFLVVGYSRGDLFLLDPAWGEVKRVNARVFDRSWAVLGRRAVTAAPARTPR